MTAPPPPPVRVDCHGIGTTEPTPQQPQQESGSESDFELDSPPHLTTPEYQEWDTTPTSPPYDYDTPSPPTLIDGGSAIPPHLSTLEYREWDTTPTSPPYDYDPPSPPTLIDGGSAMLPTFGFESEDTIYEETGNQRQSHEYAVSALKHYNSSENNKVKYELVDAITSGGIIDLNGCYGHVNFTAKADQKNSKEELFFAELRWEHNTYIATCVLSLEGEKSVGGLCGTKYDNGKMGFRIDAKHCYSCGRRLKHPKNGALYETGHVADSGYYNE